MSRIGKKAVAVPSGVTVTIEGQTVTVKGPKGQLAWTVAEEIEVKQEGGELTLSKRQDSQRAQAMWGLSRTLVANMVQGVTQGYEQTLELVGVGYRAAMKGTSLSLQLGFSHDVDVPAPAGVKVSFWSSLSVVGRRNCPVTVRRDSFWLMRSLKFSFT